MRLCLLAAFGLVLLAPLAGAQPGDGDLVLSLFDATFQNGAVVYLNPRQAAAVTTLAVNTRTGGWYNWVRMAPDNRSVVATETYSWFFASDFLEVSDQGAVTTIVPSLAGTVTGFALDGDDTWIATGQSSANLGYLLAVDHTAGRAATLIANRPDPWNDLAIVREQGIHYAVANYTTTSLAAPRILDVDRLQILSTLFAQPTTLARLAGIELDPRRGDLLCADLDGPTSQPPEANGGVEFNRVSPAGKVTTLFALPGANVVKVLADDTAWVGGFVVSPQLDNALLHYDLLGNTVLSLVTLPALPGHIWSISGLDVYGSRVLTCNGTGGPLATIGIQISSRRAAAAGASYQLALAFGRRPGVKLRGGEWLHLSVIDELFLMTAQNKAPTVFRNFSGALDAAGQGVASVVLPKGVPANLGVTVFCGGVIYKASGVVQVTNTHWFEL